MSSISSEPRSGVASAQQVEQWTLFIPPQLDLLGPGSRVTVEAAQGVSGDALSAYKSSTSRWRRVAQMTARSHEEQRGGHYWRVVWCDPAFAAVVKAEMEYLISPAQTTVEIAAPSGEQTQVNRGVGTSP